MDTVQHRLEALRKSIAEKHQVKARSRWETIKQKLKKGALITAAVGALGAIPAYYLAEDFFLKRQNYPERNVLYRASQVIHVAGGSEDKRALDTDQDEEIKVYDGGVQSKVGTYLFRTQRERRDDISYYNMDNPQKIRIASATQKPERVQSGISLGGSTNFKEQLAEIILSNERKSPSNYTTYDFIPERGLEEIELTVVTHPNHQRTLENKMIEKRSLGLGWFFGKEYRSGTFLEGYARTPHNQELTTSFLRIIAKLNSSDSIDKSKRIALIQEALAVESRLQRIPTLASYEDGFFDVLPQGSTLYLGSQPGFWKRLQHSTLPFLGMGKDTRLRVDNFWDLFPGNIPLLNQLKFGTGDDVAYPCDKYNNGGYVLRDKFGDVAKIAIQDFFFFYGQDLLYSYYLDLNGDGDLDEHGELIGQVLCRTTHDDLVNLEELVGIGQSKKDITCTVNYSFMAPDANRENGLRFLSLCGYLESCMPDQLNRGYGKHSFLGYINRVRSDIFLHRDLTLENMSRALTEESTLIAHQDVVRVLIAAQRPYAEAVANSFGDANTFKGTYQTSPLLQERTEIGPLPTYLLFAGAAFGLRSLFKRKKQKSQEKTLQSRVHDLTHPSA
ncbi:MAG: hypothetical protein Q8L34_02595 [Candidatus Woesearchaeota archaeon]|nr:hypothetical protein [Candidatus Woesearchaeota archaeon]